MTAREYVALPPGWMISSRLLALWPIDDDHSLELGPCGRTPEGRLRWYYRLARKNDTVFAGTDIASGVGGTLTTNELVNAARAVLSLLTLRPGDTDREYFYAYTEDQRNWCDAHAESLSIYAMEDVCGYCGGVDHPSPGCVNR
ncbi:hypothetical protein ABGB17_17200 [Sphaerisporangium sp. B11E5]|uniref:hypothetical protein n=1 Tax=Sphaerisporangium sp. B11E5 TaxID=3153563 RepID=UPI00325E1F82